MSRPWLGDLLAQFGTGMLVLADRNFWSHTLARPNSVLLIT